MDSVSDSPSSLSSSFSFLTGYCPSGQTSQVSCITNAGCSSGQTCNNGLCCTTTGQEYASKKIHLLSILQFSIFNINPLPHQMRVVVWVLSPPVVPLKIVVHSCVPLPITVVSANSEEAADCVQL